MPSITTETISWQDERAELGTVLHSPLFARSPALSRLLSYLCEKTFAGETDQIKEYSVAVDVFDRGDSFDQDSDSIVRVEANRLRKRLSEYYARDGAAHVLHISIPVGQYVPQFQRVLPPGQIDRAQSSSRADSPTPVRKPSISHFWFVGAAIVVAAALMATAWILAKKSKPQSGVDSARLQEPLYSAPVEPSVGLPVGEQIHILAGSSRKYVDHAGKLWSPDSYFSGGTAVSSAVRHIWRTQDPIIYRNSRQGDFSYNIPLKPGIYELRLHFAETFYGPEDPGGGGEGSRMMTVSANSLPLLHDLDVLADAGGARTAEIKVFHDLSPASDGQLHLSFSGNSGSAMLSAIEILPGVRRQIRPVRIIARDVPYYSNDSRWWSPDVYFKGGQISSSQEPADGTDDPEFYETERWGHFSYAIPVVPGKYTVALHFIEHHTADSFDRVALPSAQGETASDDRVFSVFCNGRTVVEGLDIVKQVGENRPLVRKIKGLEPNAQGKLLLEFVPVTRYATVTAIEVMPE